MAINTAEVTRLSIRSVIPTPNLSEIEAMEVIVLDELLEFPKAFLPTSTHPHFKGIKNI